MSCLPNLSSSPVLSKTRTGRLCSRFTTAKVVTPIYSCLMLKTTSSLLKRRKRTVDTHRPRYHSNVTSGMRCEFLVIGHPTAPATHCKCGWAKMALHFRRLLIQAEHCIRQLLQAHTSNKVFTEAGLVIV